MATRKKNNHASNGNGKIGRGNEPIQLSWGLAELPTSQHRAGLAGLALSVQHLGRLGTNRGTCAIEELTAHTLTLRIDEKGLEALFDLVYAASNEESEESQPRKNKQGEPVAPIRTEERVELNAKGKESKKKLFIYPRVVPKGEVVLAMDPTQSGSDGVWTKLWRDFIWNIMRGVPAQREPFESRAAREALSESTDPSYVLATLRGNRNVSVKLPSTYFLGAQERTADDVSFQDKARFQFLLHFWPQVASIYVPQIEDRDGKKSFFGYAVAVPDVADVEAFVEELPATLRTRGTDRAGYRPREAVVTLPAESALVLMDMLRTRLGRAEGARPVSDLLLGVDVFHSDKQGNSVRLLSSARVEPESSLDEYGRIRTAFWDVSFRRQRVVNLLSKRPWFHGFDELLSTLSHERLLGRNSTFAHDARVQFESRSIDFKGDNMNTGEQQPSLEVILLKIVNNYLGRKLKTKHELDWTSAKGDEGKRQKYDEERERLAKDAFFAIRGRTGQDFVDFFAGTLCSVSHRLSNDEFGILSGALRERTAEVRTLTMMALSARG